MNTFKGYVLTKKNSLKLNKNLKFPKLKKFQLIIKIEYTSICGSQLFEISGLRGHDKYLPHLLGHEGVGTVFAKHKSVKKFRVGDEVILTWIKGEGGDSGGLEIEDSDGKRINAGPVTTFSNYSIISENRLVKKPKDMPNDLAPLFGCSIPTGFGMALNYYKIKKNTSILLIGIGGIGYASLIALSSLTFNSIIILDNDIKKLKLIKELGFKNVIHISEKNKKKIKNEIKTFGIDFCIESSGNSKMIEFGFDVIKDDGTIVFASHPKSNQKISLDPHALIRGKKILGSWGGGISLEKSIRKYWSIYKKSRNATYLNYQKKYNFSELNYAINDLKMKKIFRPIIKI